MAWSYDTQFQTQDRQSQVEYGAGTIGTDGTVEVTTRLSTIRSVNVTPNAGAIVDTGIKCDLTITSGAVTFTDYAGAINSGRTFTYEIRGVN